MSAPRRAPVALVDDHSLFAESMKIALSLDGYDARRVSLGAAAASPPGLLSAIGQLEPRIVLLDLDLGAFGDGLQLVRPLTGAGVAVLVVTANTDRAQWGACIAHGARKVIPKLAPLTEIVDTIRRIDDGLPVMTRAERDELLQHWRDEVAADQDARARLDRLTRREAEVLGMLMTGLQVCDIARERFVSESTVRSQVKSVLAKLQVCSQLTAVGVANRVGWRAPTEPSTTPNVPLNTRLIAQRGPLAMENHQR